MISYHHLKAKPRTFRAFTGLDPHEFEQLLPSFQAAWDTYIAEHYINKKHRKRQYGGGRKATLATIEAKLVFILVYFKMYPLQEVMAYLFSMSQSQTNEWIYKLSHILQLALQQTAYTPERHPEYLAEVLHVCESVEFIIDGVERRRQRPTDKAQQKVYYSGKKKRIPPKIMSLLMCMIAKYTI